MKNLYPPRVVMTLLIRNEQDLIAENILFHHKQGIDQFIVMDNLSDDESLKIVKDLALFIPIKVISQNEDNFKQSRWVKSMEQEASLQYKADWIINNDADEFWIFPGLDVKNYLKSFPKDICCVELQRHNAVLIEEHYWEGFDAHPCSNILFEKESFNPKGEPLPNRFLYRASKNITVEQSNHNINRQEGEIVKCNNAKILHFPHRSFKDYQAKIRTRGSTFENNKDLNLSISHKWREDNKIIEKDELFAFWSRLKYSLKDCISAEKNGDIFREPLLKDELRQLIRFWQHKQLEKETKNVKDNTIKTIDEKINELKSEVGGLKSLKYNNLPFMISGPQKHKDLLLDWMGCFSENDLLSRFTDLRDLFSIYPKNQAVFDFLSLLLRIHHPHSVRRLSKYCEGKNIIVYFSCQKYLERSRKSSISFEAHGYKTLIVVGTNENYPDTLGLDFDGKILKLPVLDDYEHLGSKVFYAYLILSLCGNPISVTKVDDDMELNDFETFSYCLKTINEKNIQYFGHIISSSHREQVHGWHIGKCSNKELNRRGYQYPMPSKYACGGFGYILGSKLLKECALMYLSMQSFFEMKSVQLEDVFVGLAAQGASIKIKNCHNIFERIKKKIGYPDVTYATLPGLRRNKN